MLVLIILLGAYFRTLGLTDWDAGTGQHPDERFFADVTSTVRLPADLAELYDAARSPLNPRNYHQFGFFTYGPMPVYLTRMVAVALTPPEALPEQVPRILGPPRTGIDAERPHERRSDVGELRPNPERSFPRLPLVGQIFNPDGRNLTGYGEIQKVGRSLAALFDLGSLLLIYLLGRQLFDRRVGLLAALLAALAVMPIQQSHFFVDPIFSTFFCLLSLYWAVRVAQGGGWLAYTLLGLSIGAAMANRITMATLGGVALVAALVAAMRFVQQRGDGSCAAFWNRFFGREFPLLVLAGLLTILGFRTFAPDAFVGSRADGPVLMAEGALLHGAGFFDLRPEPRFLDNLQTVRGLVSGEVDFPPSQQWVGRTAYLFPWLNMVLWGMGPAMGLAAWGGLLAFALLGLRRLLWPPPAAPPLSAAWVVFAWVAFYFAWQGNQFAITLRYLLPIYGGLLVFGAWGLVRLWERGRARRSLLVVVPIVVVLFSFGWAYAFTRIYIQPHSRVMAAQWFAEHARPGSYVMAEIWDDPLPLQVTRATWGGTFQGISSAPYAEDDLRKYVGGFGGDGSREEGLLDQLERADYITITSNRVYDSTSRLRMRYPALMRYYEALFSGELGFALVAEITSYPRFLGIPIPDQRAEEAFHVYDHPRVLIFAKTEAFSRERAEALIINDVLWGEVYKSPVRIADRNATALRLTDGQWPHYREAGTWAQLFGQPEWLRPLAPLFWLLLVQGLGLATFALLFPLLPTLPDRGYSLAKLLGLLLVAYLAWLAGSLGTGVGVPGQGNLHGMGWGPFPMAFTPATLWLFAGPLLLVGGLAAWMQRQTLRDFWQQRATALLTAEVVFLVFLLIGLGLRWLNPDLWHPARGGEKPMDLAYLNAVLKSGAFPPYDPWHAGGYLNYYYFGFVLVGALTHLSGVVPSIAYNLAVATIMALTALGAWGVVYNLMAPRLLGSAETPPPAQERRALLAGGLAPVLLLLLGNLAQAIWYLSGYAQTQASRGRGEWAYWDATRIVAGTVNEFPFFTFLFGDLHAHMLVLPLSLALLGLAVAYATDPLHCVGAATRRLLFYVGSMGLLVGAIRATNTWDYPTFVGLTALIMAGVAWRAGRTQRPWAWLLLWIAGPPLLMVLLGNLLFAPFTAAFATESSGVQLWREGLAAGTLAQVLEAPRTTLWELTLLHGHWIALTATSGLLLARRYWGTTSALVLTAGFSLLYFVGLWRAWPGLLLCLPLLGGAVVLIWRLRRAPYHLLLPGLWMGGALGLLVLVELVAVQGDIGRMNTVFKFGLHTWLLFALAGAALLPQLLAGTGRLVTPPALLTSMRGGFALLAVATLIYPLTATPARAADRWNTDAPRSLDGAAYMHWISAERHGQRFALNEDATAIDWLQRNVEGTPVILEAHQPSYQWAGRVANHTGLPTLLGWEWHQIQQRGVVGAGPIISYRQQIIGVIYSTSDSEAALELLRLYGVEYIYIGSFERDIYDPAGLAKFPNMAAQGLLETVFQQGQTSIYRVVHPGTPRMLTSDRPIVAPTLNTAPPLRLDGPVNRLPVVDEYAWNERLGQDSLGATLLWLLAFYGLALLGMPLAHAVFGHWPDGGVAWARLIGLLLLGYAVWLPTSLGVWSYNLWGSLGGLVLVLGLNGVILWWQGARLHGNSDRERLMLGVAALGQRLKQCRPRALWSEALFLLGFGSFALIRAFNPDLWHPVWGGEKPMEFGFLNAILRSAVMPPYDPFFSDGYINYYYYGFFLFSLPIKLTGIAPAIGFNLAVATLGGLLLAGAFALVLALTQRVRYGLLGAAMVGVAGNLAGVFGAGWSQGFGAISNALGTAGLRGMGAQLDSWYIGPSRVIPYTINEFPFFSLLFADLHPHLMALPMTLLVAALGYVLLENNPSQRPFSVGLLVLSLGALAITNSWDFPTYGLLMGLVFLGAAWRAHGPRGRTLPLGGMLKAGLLAAGLGLAGLMLYAPFFDNYWAPVGGIGRVAWDGATKISDYLIIYGVAMAILLPTVGAALWRVTRGWERSHSDTPRPRLPWLALGLLLLAWGCAVLLPSLGLRLALVALLLAGLLLLSQRALAPATWYALLLAWLAWAVSLGVELVYIRDHVDGSEWYRMNTVFKFGLQIWVLLALAAAALLPRLLQGLRRSGGGPAQAGALVVLCFLLALAAVYPLAATPARIANRFEVSSGLTLDGLAFMREAQFSYDCQAFGGCEPGVASVTIDLRGDAAAIAWLNQQMRGTPIVVQSNQFFYRAYGIRIAANTGLPTVVSALHVDEQRDPAAAARRDRAVEQFYRSSDIEQALRFLAEYRVNYIYVGGVERALYPQAGLAKFTQMSDNYLDVIYNNAEVQIYAVRSIPDQYARLQPHNFASEAAPPPPPAAPAEVPAELAELEAAHQANPTHGPTAFGLAEQYRRLGRLDDAAQVLAPAAQANPDDIGVIHLWGDILSEAGRFREAEEAYMVAAKNNPTAGNWNKLGAALVDWGELDKAAIALGNALMLDPQEPEPYYQIGRLFALRGDHFEASDALQTYLRLAPEGRWAAAARELLAELEE
ncbi:hypothetical protein CJ255_08930 [Candidatus Viridilinea mediisalina]|uniref:Uncharacterized protein n=2 Tax=Candidatus Viridilinea mediisalina TaxID=2024553 RepID=A0A2A6RKH2_9CHLR|nr:hypothetical protein CJ255_08930 [Candidatus Viridilinea mediisalina]